MNKGSFKGKSNQKQSQTPGMNSEKPPSLKARLCSPKAILRQNENEIKK